MNSYESKLRGQWSADLLRIAAQIEDLKARIESESRQVYASLSAEVAALQSELERLEAAVASDDEDVHARRIARQIEELSAKGDAAYQLLQAGPSAQFDPTEAEIRRLEAIASTASGAARAKIEARVRALRSAQAASQMGAHADDDLASQSGDTA